MRSSIDVMMLAKASYSGASLVVGAATEPMSYENATRPSTSSVTLSSSSCTSTTTQCGSPRDARAAHWPAILSQCSRAVLRIARRLLCSTSGLKPLSISARCTAQSGPLVDSTPCPIKGRDTLYE